MSEDDKYTYPGSGGVLVNLKGIRDAAWLDAAMNDYASAAMAELRTEPTPDRLDYGYLRSIHTRLFERIVPGIAGKLRDVDVQATGVGIAKTPGIVGLNVTRRRRRASLHHYAGKRMRSWRPGALETRGTTGCCIRSKSSRFVIHSFREGNTRSQFVFFSQLAEQAGYRIDPTQFAPGAPLRDAFVEARFHSQDTGRNDQLAAVLGQAITPFEPGSRSHDAGAAPERDRATEEAWQGVELARGGFPKPGTGMGRSGPPTASAGPDAGGRNIETRRGRGGAER